METEEKSIKVGDSKIVITQNINADNPFYGEFGGFITACSEIKDIGDGVYYERTKANTTEELILTLKADGYIVTPLYSWLDYAGNIHLCLEGNGYGWHDNFAGLLIREKDEDNTYTSFGVLVGFLHDWEAFLNNQVYSVEVCKRSETVETWRDIYGFDTLTQYLKKSFNLSILENELLNKINTEY